jgi:predicted permease
MNSPPQLERLAAERVAALPGVREVALAFRAPLSWNGMGYTEPVSFPDRLERPTEAPPEIPTDWVSSNYFRLLGIAVLRGRTFNASEQTAGSPDAVIVNEAMAQQYWPGQDAVGKLIRVGGPKGALARIVGVVRNSPAVEIAELPAPYLYRPFWHGWEGDYAVIASTRQPDAGVLVEPARQAIHQADRRFAHLLVTTQSTLIQVATVQYQLLAELVSALGIIGVLLTAVGLYGVVSWRVTQRRREIGIRMAIGANRSDTVRLILRDTAAMGLAGLAAGIPLALAATRLASAALFGVHPWDPLTFAVVVVLLGAVLLLAGFLPARRATGIDPVTALRCE